MSRPRRPLFLLALIAFATTACSPAPAPEPTPALAPLPTDTTEPTPNATHRAGLRASSYGPAEPFPDSNYWAATSAAFAASLEDAQPALIWIIGEIEFTDSGGDVRLKFPAPTDAPDDPHILYSHEDLSETYLSRFDAAGLRVWLQVEPGNADVPTLIDLVLSRYGSHPCVAGFGVDLEWYHWSLDNDEGSAVSDAETAAWSEQVRAFNPDYELFLKHWEVEKMPPSYREGLLFLDDSQEFDSLDDMLDEFDAWGAAFAPAPVGFQFGYEADQAWWGQIADPPAAISKAIFERIPNAREVYWVDFTMEQLWPRE
jgi:hypothetical protein